MSPPPAPMRFVPMYMPAATKEDVAKKIVEMIGTAGASDTALAELMIDELKGEMQDLALNTVPIRAHSLAVDGTLKATEKKYPDARSWCAETVVRCLGPASHLPALYNALATIPARWHGLSLRTCVRARARCTATLCCTTLRQCSTRTSFARGRRSGSN